MSRPVYSRNFFNGHASYPGLTIPFPEDGFLTVIRDMQFFCISKTYEDNMIVQIDTGAPAAVIFATGTAGLLGDLGQGDWQQWQGRVVVPKPFNLLLTVLQGEFSVVVSGYDLTLP